MPASVNGTGDNFPSGQCTYWASFRYHQLTGYYVPFSGNANQWAYNAANYGWIVSSTPVVPSIICLQAGVQQADGQDGHVGVVESINPDGTVETSDLNWGLTIAERQAVSHITFNQGYGVSFIYAVDKNGNPVGSTGGFSVGGGGLVQAVTSFSVSPSASVPVLFAAIDTAMELVNPFNGINAVDPVTYIADVFSNLVPDITALVLRTVCVVLGLFVIYAVLKEFVLSGVQEALTQALTTGEVA
jgi:surface antigen